MGSFGGINNKVKMQMIDKDRLPNHGRISGTLHLDNARRARRMQTLAGIGETLKLLPDKRRVTDLLPPSDRA